MQRDRLYLVDIVSAADAIAGFVSCMTEDRFVNYDLVRSAVLHKLTIIGEAAARISDELREQHPATPWRSIVAFRNIAVHRYFSIDWSIVWNAATVDVPTLRAQISKIIDSQTGENSP